MLYKILPRSVGRVYLLVYIIDTCCIRYYQGPPHGAGISTGIYNRYMLYKILPRFVGRVYLLVYIIDTCCILDISKVRGAGISTGIYNICCIRYYQGPWGGYIY